jgi:hypothetical protein
MQIFFANRTDVFSGIDLLGVILLSMANLSSIFGYVESARQLLKGLAGDKHVSPIHTPD